MKNMTLVYRGNVLLAIPLQSWWFCFAAMVLLLLFAYIFYRVKLKAVKCQKAEVERQLAERNELYRYAQLDQQRAREEAALADKTKKEILAKISHEIRNPMNAIWGMASLLNETPLNAEQVQYTSTILQSGQNLIQLINEILMKDLVQYSNVETAKELLAIDYDVRTAIEEVLDLFADKATKVGIDLLYSIDTKVPRQVNGDVQRLKQVLMNLLENAFRFTTKGHISIAVKVAPSVDDMPQLAFTVSDTGIGMNPERLQRVKSDLKSSDDFIETQRCIGVTLIMCKKLISLLGGRLSVSSTENKGATFHFTINAAASRKTVNTPLLPDITALQNKKILIADENRNLAAQLQHQLAQWGAEAMVCTGEEEALGTLSATAGFHLVLTSVNLTNGTGFSLAKKISECHPQMGVVLLNRAGNERYREHNILFRSVVTKPVRQHLLASGLLSGFKATASVSKKPENVLSADFAQRYPLTILIAEDDAMNQQMVSMVLKKLGYEPVIASNGKEVLEVVSQNHFDLIFMDVQMPEMDGLEASRMIRICLTAQPVIVAMTANTLQGDRELCLESGMDDYMSKPVKLSAIVNILEKWAKQQQASLRQAV